jgi:glycosyltransferase involved in cell wall biosynthesis
MIKTLTWMLSVDWALADALRRREREAPFDFVQSASLFGSGLFIKRSHRPHLVFCCDAGDLYARFDRDSSPSRKCQVWLERLAMLRADIAYAHSRFVSDYFRQSFGLDLKVVRPPAFVELQAEALLPWSLPCRYFLHFGHLKSSKGTAWLAEALPLAWVEEPELTMVWIGRMDRGDWARWSNCWGNQKERIMWLGPQPKSRLYSVLQQAEASVLPSFVDNLPNTAIESLTMGIPVIGTDGASIDELVENGVTGELVPPGDAKGLASALVRVWRGESTARRGFRWQSPIAEQMQPESAVNNLLALAGLLNRV